MSYKVLIIEDDPLIAADLQDKLESLDYTVIGHTDDRQEVLNLVATRKPEVLIADIVLEGRNYDGIDLVREIYDFYKAPVIYLTANSESATVKKASGSHPAAFLLKPFRISEISINIDLAIKNFRNNYSFEKANSLANDSIFIPESFTYQRIYKKDILYVEADGSYTQLVTKERKHQLTLNLKHFNKQLDDSNFIRVSRKHLINTDHIHRINGNTLYLQDNTALTISKSKRQDLLERFPILKTQ